MAIERGFIDIDVVPHLPHMTAQVAEFVLHTPPNQGRHFIGRNGGGLRGACVSIKASDAGAASAATESDVAAGSPAG